jgi:SPP1 family predicted phage head-tail adaptor
MPESTRLAAGKLRHRITILRPNLKQDTFGGWKNDDGSVFAASVPAAIETLTGRELYTAQQKVSEVTHRITIRWQKGIQAKMKIVWFDEVDRFFDIQAPENPDGRHKLLHLLCIERNDSVRTNV